MAFRNVIFWRRKACSIYSNGLILRQSFSGLCDHSKGFTVRVTFTHFTPIHAVLAENPTWSVCSTNSFNHSYSFSILSKDAWPGSSHGSSDQWTTTLTPLVHLFFITLLFIILLLSCIVFTPCCIPVCLIEGVLTHSFAVSSFWTFSTLLEMWSHTSHIKGVRAGDQVCHPPWHPWYMEIHVTRCALICSRSI